MATRTLGLEHAPLLDKLRALIQREQPDPVKQQVAIELLTVSHAMRAGNRKDAITVADGIHKHVRQLIDQM